jgi:hypothetical protein
VFGYYSFFPRRNVEKNASLCNYTAVSANRNRDEVSGGKLLKAVQSRKVQGKSGENSISIVAGHFWIS